MIDLQNISLSFGERVMFDELSFQLGDSDKVCLSGRNGTGKTTLLKLICGEQTVDSGNIMRSRETSIGYLRQHMDVPLDKTVFETAFAAFDRMIVVEAELEKLHEKMADPDADHDALYVKVERLQSELDAADWHSCEARTHQILDGLGFTTEERSRPIGSFSGGYRMRAALAKILLEQPTCLLLDEPTNHLDLDSNLWLEDYLRNFDGSFVLVSHDRYFVDRICSRMVEIEYSTVNDYPLPFSRYEAEREARRIQIEQAYKRQQEKIGQLERYIERFKAKNSMATQAKSKEKMIDRMEKVILPQSMPDIRVRFPAATPSGKVVFKADSLEKSFGDHVIFKDANFVVQAGDKVAIAGHNGAGKTTLLNVMLGVIPASKGAVTLGANVSFGYFSQYDEPDEKEKQTDIYTMISAENSSLKVSQVRGILGSMLFSDDDVFKKYGVLSGGERTRVRLCRLLVRNHNVLVLDEPTNHLDIYSKDILLEALRQYNGTVLFVSHDRYFAENASTRVLTVDNMRVRDYPGTYAEYWKELAQVRVGVGLSTNKTKTQGGDTGGGNWEVKKERDKTIRKLRGRIEKAEAEIGKTEARVTDLIDQQNSPANSSNAVRCAELHKEQMQCEAKIEKCYAEMEKAEKELKELEG